MNRDGKDEWRRIGGPIEILGNVIDEASEGWGLQVMWSDWNSVVHSATLRWKALLGEDKSWLKRLVSGGWRCSMNGRDINKLAEFFAHYKADRCLKAVEQTGWYDGRFVLPNSVLMGASSEGHKGPDVCLSSVRSSRPIYQKHGSLEGWQNSIGRWADGNSPLGNGYCFTKG